MVAGLGDVECGSISTGVINGRSEPPFIFPLCQDQSQLKNSRFMVEILLMRAKVDTAAALVYEMNLQWLSMHGREA